MRDLTQLRLHELLSYDEVTGLFTWRHDRGLQNIAGSVAGHTQKNGYVRLKVDGRNYQAHRLVWLYLYGCWPTAEIDHIDTVKNNNCRANLREVPRTSNMHNQRRPQSGNKSGYLGVSPDPSGKWKAQIRANKKDYYLGLFATPELAHAAYLEAKARLHPTQPL